MRLCIAITLLIASIASTPVLAQTQAATQSGTASISRDDCRRMVRYHPDADVAYKPGVDVHGKAVAPADLAKDDEAGAPQKITIDLHAQLGQVLGNSTPTLLGQSFVNTGQVSIDLNDGSVTLNGKKVDADAETAIAAACRKAGVQ
jgi:hypothetical protein